MPVRPEDSQRQDYEADEWAAKWILDASPNGLTGDFRLLVASVAFVWIGLVDEVNRRQVTHPHAWDRIATALLNVDVDELSEGLLIGSYLIKTLFMPHAPAPRHEDPRKNFRDLMIEVCWLPR